MREQPEITPVAKPERPGTVTAALWIGWTYLALSLLLLLFYLIPQRYGYISGLPHKPAHQFTQDDINMMVHPDASVFGSFLPFFLVLLLNGFLLHKFSLGRSWARTALVGWFGFRILLVLAIFLFKPFALFEIIPQAAIVIIAFLPPSRAWFSTGVTRISDRVKATTDVRT
jgi:hypothetical protein